MRQTGAEEAEGNYGFTTTEERNSKECKIAWEKDLSGFCIVLITKDYKSVADEIDRLRGIEAECLSGEFRARRTETVDQRDEGIFSKIE